MDDWDGHERRSTPYELMNLIKSEQQTCRSVVDKKLEQIIDNQAAMRRELDRWNQTAIVIRVLTLALAGFVASVAALWEWGSEHLK